MRIVPLICATLMITMSHGCASGNCGSMPVIATNAPALLPQDQTPQTYPIPYDIGYSPTQYMTTPYAGNTVYPDDNMVIDTSTLDPCGHLEAVKPYEIFCMKGFFIELLAGIRTNMINYSTTEEISKLGSDTHVVAGQQTQQKELVINNQTYTLPTINAPQTVLEQKKHAAALAAICIGYDFIICNYIYMGIEGHFGYMLGKTYDQFRKLTQCPTEEELAEHLYDGSYRAKFFSSIQSYSTSGFFFGGKYRIGVHIPLNNAFLYLWIGFTSHPNVCGRTCVNMQSHTNFGGSIGVGFTKRLISCASLRIEAGYHFACEHIMEEKKHNFKLYKNAQGNLASESTSKITDSIKTRAVSITVSFMIHI